MIQLLMRKRSQHHFFLSLYPILLTTLYDPPSPGRVLQFKTYGADARKRGSPFFIGLLDGLDFSQNFCLDLVAQGLSSLTAA